MVSEEGDAFECKTPDAFSHEDVLLGIGENSGSTRYGSGQELARGSILHLYDASYLRDRTSVESTGNRSWCQQLRSLLGNVNVCVWLLTLTLSYSLERGSFKLLVDRTGPFRLFSASFISAAHAILLFAAFAAKAIRSRTVDFKACLPLGDVALISVLDTMHLLLCVVTGSYVAAPLTVILVQFTVAVTAVFSKFSRSASSFRGNNSVHDVSTSADTESHDNRVLSNRRGLFFWPECTKLFHLDMWGAILIFASVTVGLLPSFLSIHGWNAFFKDDELALRYSYNTIIFTLSCVPAAASQLYKAHALLQYQQPIESDSMDLVLAIFKFCFTMVMSPLLYRFQGLGAGSNWIYLYPTKEFRRNYVDALSCFFATRNDEEAESLYPEPAHCRWSLSICLLHVLSMFVIGHAVNRIVHANATKDMYKCVTVGVVLAVSVMCVYEYSESLYNHVGGIETLYFSSAFLVVAGLELFHRFRQCDPTYETVYPDQGNLYEE